MKCADARHLIHLSVGDDTLSPEEQSLSEHLHECSDCRAYHAGMLDAMTAVRVLRDSTSAVRQPSIWPSVQRAIRSGQSQLQRQPQRHFSGSVAALCACSLVLALTTIVGNLPGRSPESYYPMPGPMNVSSPMNTQPGLTPWQSYPVNPEQAQFVLPNGQRVQPVWSTATPPMQNPDNTF